MDSPAPSETRTPKDSPDADALVTLRRVLAIVAGAGISLFLAIKAVA